MNLSRVFRSQQWRTGRRIALVILVLVLGLRNYGGTISSWLRSPAPEQDVVLTHTEFRADLGDARPSWIIGLKNQSARYTYDRVELEATYKDQAGAIIETEKMTIRQKLGPGEEQLVGSTDIKARPGAVAGTLRVLKATNLDAVKP
jgi:hypothetical protein